MHFEERSELMQLLFITPKGTLDILWNLNSPGEEENFFCLSPLIFFFHIAKMSYGMINFSKSFMVSY